MHLRADHVVCEISLVLRSSTWLANSRTSGMEIGQVRAVYGSRLTGVKLRYVAQSSHRQPPFSFTDSLYIV
jgi:hypothetical protein